MSNQKRFKAFKQEPECPLCKAGIPVKMSVYLDMTKDDFEDICELQKKTGGSFSFGDLIKKALALYREVVKWELKGYDVRLVCVRGKKEVSFGLADLLGLGAKKAGKD